MSYVTYRVEEYSIVNAKWLSISVEYSNKHDAISHYRIYAKLAAFSSWNCPSVKFRVVKLETVEHIIMETGVNGELQDSAQAEKETVENNAG